jgi:hypothetical protein
MSLRRVSDRLRDDVFVKYPTQDVFAAEPGGEAIMLGAGSSGAAQPGVALAQRWRPGRASPWHRRD